MMGYRTQRKLSTISVMTLAIVVPMALAQVPKTSSTEAAAFDVASIRPNNSLGCRPVLFYRADGIHATCVTLQQLIWNTGASHQFGDHPIEGAPRWADSARFDVEAKVVGTEAESLQKFDWQQRQHIFTLMLRSLLADRFKLVVHKRPIEVPIFELVIAKNGPKLKEAQSKDPTYPNGQIMNPARGQMKGRGASLDWFAAILSTHVQREVVNRSGLTGRYDFTLQWQPEEGSISDLSDSGTPQEPQPQSDDLGPSIFTAIQEQLGLRLISAKGPGEAIVIDHVERPSEN
ncbi:MAG: TIGR03435 family protein [Terracidiphilus sp.]